MPSAPTPADLASACGVRPGVVCQEIFSLTHSRFLAGGAETFFAIPLRIALILAIALIVRRLAHRSINRLVRSTVAGEHLDPLRKLRGRATARIFEAVELPVAERRRQRAETTGSVLTSVTSLLILGIGFVLILGELGINLAPIVASAGIVGVAVGFGAQNLVRDFLTGIFMILEDQYGVGDVIDAGPASGSVEAVGLRTTRLRDVNGVVWHIRNGEITRVGNMSQTWSRALLDVPVSYRTDVARAREVIKQAANAVRADPDYAEKILEEPEVWGVERFDADGLIVRLVVKTVPLEQWVVARALRERIKRDFDDAGIEIPLAQRSVWLRTGGDPRPEARHAGPDTETGRGVPDPTAASEAARLPAAGGPAAADGPG